MYRPILGGDKIGPTITSNAEKVESQYMKFHRKYALILSPSDGFAAGEADVLVDGLMAKLQENDADDVAVWRLWRRAGVWSGGPFTGK